MNRRGQRIPNGARIFIAAAVLMLGAAAVARLAGFASAILPSAGEVVGVGLESPAECEAAGIQTISDPDSKTTTPFTVKLTSPAGKVLDFICIKSGNQMFGDTGHSGDFLGFQPR